MKKVKLGEFVNIRQGLAINKASSHLVSKKQNETFIYPLLKIADMIENKFSKFISSNVNKNVIATNDDIIYTRTGKVGLVFRKFQGVVHNNSFIVSLKNNNMNKNYLYYILQSSFVKKQAIELSKTSVQPDLAHSKFKSIKIPFIDDINTQEKIANILSNIDDKIENNNKISAKLEQMAKLIYDYYFVQFDYPDENGKPYKSSGGAMKYNEILKREIPINWEVIKIIYLVDLYQPKTLSEKNFVKNGKYYVYGANGIIGKYDKFNHKNREIIIGCRGSCGNIKMTMPYSWINGNSMVAKPKDNFKYQEFIFYSLSKDRISPFITGSSQPQITRTNLENLYLIKPTTNEIDKFEKLAFKIRLKIETISLENQKLSSLRDFLLPMLMNGQVSFKN